MCIPSRATVHNLFSVARDAGIIPDIYMDPILTSFLSLESGAVLQHRYDSLQRIMSREQQSTFGISLSEKLGSRRVTHGRVGIVALALAMLFDQVAQQVSKTCSHCVLLLFVCGHCDNRHVLLECMFVLFLFCFCVILTDTCPRVNRGGNIRVKNRVPKYLWHQQLFKDRSVYPQLPHCCSKPCQQSCSDGRDHRAL